MVSEGEGEIFLCVCVWRCMIDVFFFRCVAVQMECYAGGYPTPRISWRRENNAILPTGGSIYRGNVLRIKHIRKEDRGTYYCVAENGVGRGTKRN